MQHAVHLVVDTHRTGQGIQFTKAFENADAPAHPVQQQRRDLAAELFGREVLPEFREGRAEKDARKREELAPYIQAALARKQRLRPLADDEIPVVYASREREAFYHKE